MFYRIAAWPLVVKVPVLVAGINLDDPTTGRLIEQTLLAPVIVDRIAAAHDLAQRVIGHTGFFEWDSGPDGPAPR